MLVDLESCVMFRTQPLPYQARHRTRLKARGPVTVIYWTPGAGELPSLDQDAQSLAHTASYPTPDLLGPPTSGCDSKPVLAFKSHCQKSLSLCTDLRAAACLKARVRKEPAMVQALWNVPVWRYKMMGLRSLHKAAVHKHLGMRLWCTLSS